MGVRESGSSSRSPIPRSPSRRREQPWPCCWTKDFREDGLARTLELNRQGAEQERQSRRRGRGDDHERPEENRPSQVPKVKCRIRPGQTYLPRIPTRSSSSSGSGSDSTRGATMSWVLFLDESGHDHKIMPYEVRRWHRDPRRGTLAFRAGNEAARTRQFWLSASGIWPRTEGKHAPRPEAVPVRPATCTHEAGITSQALPGFSHQGTGEKAADP